MADPEALQALKELALQGAAHSFVETNSSDLAERLRTSQQTASRRLLDLERLGYIRREKGVRNTLVRITEEGVGLLLDEFSAYKRIFEKSQKLVIKGKVASGLGEGRYYLDQKGYIDQFVAKLGFKPYPGTLNLEIRGPELNKLRILKAASAIPIDSFQDKERTFGAVDAWRARMRDVEGAAILPKRTHHTRTLEIIAPHYLRDRLGLKDGDELEVEVKVE
jgi:riboflavin kinase, archaea type